MDLLPTEIKDKIFALLSSASLEDVISFVCLEWAEISFKILNSRVNKLFSSLSSEYLKEIRYRLHPFMQNDERLVLREHEKSFLSENFELRQTTLRESVVEKLIVNVWETRGCECDDMALCTVRSIHFMPCHQLIVVQIPERIAFYSMSIVQQFQNTKFLDGDKEYETVLMGSSNNVQNIWIDNNTHTAVSVHKDLIVSQETTRALILFRVIDADHASRKVNLENVRRIFLPLWSCAVVILADKVCSLFTTGTVGLWSMSEDDISVSGNTCASTDILRAMRISRIYSLNYLVLVKIVSDFNNSVSWTIFDSNCASEGFQLYPIPLHNLITSCFMNENEDCVEVIDIFSSTNAIFVHCKVRSLDDVSICEEKLIVKRIKKSPDLEDFIEQKRFAELFNNEKNSDKSRGVETVTIPFSGSFIMPFSPISTKTQNFSVDSGRLLPFVRFLGLSNHIAGFNKGISKKKIRIMSIDVINL